MNSIVTVEWFNCSVAYLRADRGILLELNEQFSFQVPNYRFMPAYKASRWDGWIRPILLDGECPVGLIPSVIDYLKGSGREVRLTKEFRAFKEEFKFTFDDISIPFVPHDSQVEALRIALEKKRQVILSPTSSGKSLIVYGITRAMELYERKTLVIVNSLMLINQMKSDIGDYSVNDKDWDVEEKVHLLADGSPKKTNKNIVIATWQTLQHIKDAEWFRQWKAVIVDECHGCKAAVLSEIMNKCINAFVRIGLSGSLDGSQVMETSLIGHFGPIKRVISTRELMDAGKVSDLIVKSVVLKYPNSMREEMFYRDADNKKKRIVYKEEIAKIIKNERRNRFICQLANSAKGNTLVLTTLVKEHCIPLFEMMKELYPEKEVFFIGTSVPAQDRERIRKLVETKENVVIFASYSIFSTGISIKRLHNVILASPSKSVIRIIQTIGRVLRLHESKDRATVFDIVDDMRCGLKSLNYALSHFMERVKIYQKEKFEMKIMEINL